MVFCHTNAGANNRRPSTLEAAPATLPPPEGEDGGDDPVTDDTAEAAGEVTELAAAAAGEVTADAAGEVTDEADGDDS